MTQIGITGNPRASDPAHHAVAVVRSDTADLPAASTFIYVGVSGNLKVTMLGGEILNSWQCSSRMAPDPGDPRVDQHHGHQHNRRLALVPSLPAGGTGAPSCRYSSEGSARLLSKVRKKGIVNR
jgi:hypothetical protein